MSRIHVYFATNRDPLGDPANPSGFGKNPSTVGSDDLRFGEAFVEDGKIVEMNVLPDGAGEDLFGTIKQKMAREGRSTLVLIHGYATSFEQAVVGAAKTKEAYGPANLNVFMFSWPSDGQNFPPQAYSNDRRDAVTSGDAFSRGLLKLIDFLSDGPACGQKVHLLCHSMGNYVMRNALQHMIEQTKGQLPRVFENIFSMAADEDSDALDSVEKDKWERLPEITKHLHIYFNNHDHALNISTKTKNNPDRMGSDGPAKPLDLHSKVTLVDVSRLEGMIEAVSTIGHGYYDEKPEVIADVLQVLAGVEPDKIKGRIFIPAKNRYAISS